MRSERQRAELRRRRVHEDHTRSERQRAELRRRRVHEVQALAPWCLSQAPLVG